MKLREELFRGFTPCSNHDCIIRKPIGMGTNGSCSCLFNFSRTQLRILNSRLKSRSDWEVIKEKV